MIIDSPPLTEVIDGLALAEHADELLLVIRLGRSLQTRVVQLGELLAQHGIEPVGIAVVGVPPSESASDYYVTAPRPAPPPRARAQLSRAHDRARTVAAERRTAAAFCAAIGLLAGSAPGLAIGAGDRRPASRRSWQPTSRVGLCVFIVVAFAERLPAAGAF